MVGKIVIAITKVSNFAPDMRNELHNMRNKEVMKIYDNIISSKSVNSKYISRDLVLRLIEQHPAPRFYITPKMAERYVIAYKKQDPSILESRKLPMIKDLAEVYDKLIKFRKVSLKTRVWSLVVQSEAKSFYLTQRRIQDIIFGYEH